MIRHTPFSPSRRAFLRGGRSAVRPLRPPWALAETDFVDACTGCDACVAVCPEQVLRRGEAGHPVFDPSLGACVFCRRCVEACESGALADDAAGPWTIRAEVASSCLTLNGVTCFSCRDACGEAAIRFRPALGGARAELDASRCTGCGACIGVCPVSAIALSAQEARDG